MYTYLSTSDDSYEPVDSKNFSSNDVSNSESAFATFVSCLASQTSGSSDVDEVVRSFCSSVEVMLQSNRTKIVLCDISTIERTMSALKVCKILGDIHFSNFAFFFKVVLLTITTK